MKEAIIATIDAVRTRKQPPETLITLAVSQEHAAQVSGFLTRIGDFVGVAFAEVSQSHLPKQPTRQSSEKPYGYYASVLYKVGFFFNPKVLEAIGKDADFLDWLKHQSCCVKNDPHEGDIVAAHVRRIANGAGTSLKPPYSAIPLCNKHHQLQHQKGESAIGGKEWCDKQREKYLTEWASAALAKILNTESLGFVPPETLREWALVHDLLLYLPGVYK